MTWPTVRLGDVASIQRNSIQPEDIASGELYVGLENIKSGGQFNNVQPVKKGDLASSKFSFTNKHILYGKLRPYLAKIAIPNFNGICSTDILPVLPSNKLDLRYLAHVLLQPQLVAIANSLATGANLPRLSPTALSDLKIPLPPLAEQRRIAAILDKAEEIKRKREAAIEKLDQLAQSVFVDMFGDPVANNRKWDLIKLGDVVAKLGSGATPTGGNASYKSQGIALIRSLNVHDGEFVFKNLAYIDEKQAAKLANVEVMRGDVLLNITGASVARVCMVPQDVLPARVNQHVMIIRPSAKLDSLFLERLLLTLQMKSKLLRIGGAGATREAITKAQAENLEIIYPPLQFQKDFSKQITQIFELKDKLMKGFDLGSALSRSLQHQAFTAGFET